MAAAGQAIIEFVKDILLWVDGMGKMYGEKRGRIESDMWAHLDARR